MSSVCSNVHLTKQYGLTSEAIRVIDTVWRQVNLSLGNGSMEMLLILCLFFVCRPSLELTKHYSIRYMPTKAF